MKTEFVFFTAGSNFLAINYPAESFPGYHHTNKLLFINKLERRPVRRMSLMSKYTNLFTLVWILSGLFFHPSLAQTAPSEDDQVIDEISAVVGQHIVLKSEVDAVILQLIQQRQASYSDDVWFAALNQMVDQRVLSIHAERDTNIVVTDDEMEQVLNQRLDQITAQVGGEDQVAQLYGKSILEIREDFREEMQDQLLSEKIQSQKLGSIKVTPTEVKAWFSKFPTDSLPQIPEVVRVAHIVEYPELDPGAKSYALEVITAIRDRVVAGESTIEEMAEQFTDDQGSQSTGGRYEGSRLGELVPEFSAVASRSPIGEYSQIFESPFGYHFMRVNERRGDVVDFNHILIQIDEDNADPTNAIAFLNTIKDSILTHQMPFELMARRHSKEEQSKRIGGRVIDPRTGERDLVLDALGIQWRQTLDTIEETEISEPREVELLDGKLAYHIVLLQKRTPPHEVDLQTDYQRIEQLALQDKQNRILEEWLDVLRESVYIEFRGKAKEIADATNS